MNKSTERILWKGYNIGAFIIFLILVVLIIIFPQSNNVVDTNISTTLSLNELALKKSVVEKTVLDDLLHCYIDEDIPSITYQDVLYQAHIQKEFNKYLKIEEEILKEIQLQEKINKEIRILNVKKLASRGGQVLFVEATAYTAGYESTGKKPNHPAYGITASGAKVKENRTIACPPSYPFGTEIYIPYFKNVFTCEDRGGAIKDGKIDIYMKNLNDAIEFGRRKLEIRIIKWGE